MTTWFTSDQHYGHTNVLKYCNRPYKTIEEMNESLICNYNERVQPEDTCYFVGDFALCDKEKAQKILSRLNGNKFLVYGNHDKVGRQLKGWSAVCPYMEVKVEEDFIVLAHYAFRVWNKSHHGAFNFYGHSHGTLPTICNKATDVGVDCWDYKPVNLETLKKYLALFPPLKPVDGHGA